jgi:5-methylcytosine-specific restriction protein A
MSTNRKTQYQRKLPKGPNGRYMCRGGCNKEVKPPRRTFCSDECVHQYKLRSDPSYLRHATFERDAGVCCKCQIDTIIEKQHWRKQWLYESRNKSFQEVSDQWVSKGWPRSLDRAWWEADHIVEVCKGGGECGLENIQTLCVPCHKKKTKELKRKK